MAKEDKKEKEKSKKSGILKAVKLSILIVGICLAGAAIVTAVKLLEIKNEVIALMDEKGSEVFREDLTTLVYDANGYIIASLSSEKDAYYLESDNIPYMVKQIFLVTEDRKFYEHGGVDYKSVVRALLSLAENDGEITQGGSTITQQLARNIYLSHEVTLNRKIREVFIAWELEERYSKDEILEFYINNIYFANGLYGIEAAAKGYYNKDVSELSLSQLCFICAIPNNPEAYNPLENESNTIKRRDRILKQLLEEKIIDRSQYEEALNEDITLQLSSKIKNNYVETFVRYSATRELMALNGFEFRYFFDSNREKEEYTDEYNEMYGKCNSMLFTGGYRIYTSIDMNKQQLLQNELDQELQGDTSVNSEGVYKLQGSAVCIDNKTGCVVAVVGGRTQEYDGYTLNRAYQSFRQPGSSIKPVLIYTPLFERGYTPDSIVVDEKIDGGPVNSPNVYSGNINVRTALALSKNTVAWKLFGTIGYNNCISYLLNMQYSHIVKEDYVPAMSIGGMTYGVSALEQAAAYATLANGGIYRTPTCVLSIEDSFGNILIDNESREGKEVYRKNAALMTTDVLKDVLEWGTGKEYYVDNGVCAGKTGTTNDNKDVWFAGYSRYYTTAVWCGYDLPETIEGENIKAAGDIWRDFMEELHRGLEKKDFDMYVKEEKERNEIETVRENEKLTEQTAEETTEAVNGAAEIQSEEEDTTEENTEESTEESTEENTEQIIWETPYIPETGEGDGLYVEPY